jgi:hypothetical protein
MSVRAPEVVFQLPLAGRVAAAAENDCSLGGERAALKLKNRCLFWNDEG